MDKVSAGKIGKYEIIKVLGRGGMGEVILAQDEVLGRRVAIKRPFKSALEEGLARFQLEARAATLRHPNIPAVYEMGEEDGLPFIVMEFVEGEPLDKIINSGRHLDLITKLSIIEQVCSALGYAHEKGIIHRDIKPANVIVQPDGVAKIIDFGIAKIQDPGGNAALTQTSQILGSLYYIAPERFKGEASDGRVDIFSAGVMLFKLLTGKEPFTGGEATASYKIVNEAHSSLATYLQEYPPALDGILEKSLAKNPDDRYLVAEDFADALHEVIEDLKKSRVFQLFDDAERLAAESRYTPALELLDEAIKLDPANTQARKLRKLVREHQDRIRRAERLREFTARADEALLSENYDDALTQLKEAERLDATSTELKVRIQNVEEKKRRRDMSARAVADADAARKRGDLAGALRIVAKAIQDDPDNQKLLAANGALAREAEIEAQRGKLIEILEHARRELDARHFDAVDQLLGEADGIDPSHLETDKLRREAAKVREQEERRAILDEIQKRVNEFLKTGSYNQAADLLNRAIEKLPNEAMLHRLKALVDTETRKFESKRIVDGAIAHAREIFANSPLEALGSLQNVMDQVSNEERERLVSFERSLRQQLDALRVEQVHAGTMVKARELIAAKQFDKAIGVLESFQLEFGQNADIDDLLAFAKEERASQQHNSIVDRCTTEGRTLIRDGRLEDAIRLLERGIQETGDAALSRLLQEVQEQQVVSARKIELLRKRVELLQNRGELDEAIQLLQEQMPNSKSAPVQELLTTLLAERDQKQAIGKAIAAAFEASHRHDYAAGLETLQAVLRAYGESADLTHAMQELQTQRSSHAQEIVGKSIEAARAALLKNDPQGALAALKNATPMMEFADPKKQADWERIGQSVKKALQQSGSTSSSSTFDAQLSEIARAKPRKIPVWAIVTAGVALVAIALIIVLKMQQPPAPPQTEAHLQFAVLPLGAVVSIDDGAAVATDARGHLTVPVKPGLPHHVVVSKTGFEKYDDILTVKPGDDLPGPLILSPLPPVGTKTGTFTLLPQGGLTQVRVFVNGQSKGVKRAGDKITLPEASYRVKYAWPDYQDSEEHNIVIAKDTDFQDKFTLIKSVPQSPKPQATTGGLSIHTNPGAQITVDNQPKGSADPGGNYTLSGLTPGQQHLVSVSLDGYLAQSKPVSVVAGRVEEFPAFLTPVAKPAQATGILTASTNSVERGQSVTLNWKVNNATSAAISDIGSLAPQGTRTVSPAKTTTYVLTANGSAPLAELTVDVHEPKAQIQPPNPPVVVTPPKQPVLDQAVLEAALNGYKNVFVQASGKNPKECQALFNSSYQGKLHDFAGWCGSAKSFEVSDKCGQPIGVSSDSASLSCAETRIIHPKDGDLQKSNSTKTFHFAKNPDGSWKVVSWE